MAVTPVGNPYVESSDNVADFPGASEALAERIDIVGVNPFADSAARATAIPSPVEGQMASLNDDNLVYRYSGSAWVAVGTTPGLTLVASNTFSAVSTLSINDCFSATYNNYQILISASTSTDITVRARLRVAGSDLSTSTYSSPGVSSTGGTASGRSGLFTSMYIGQTSVR